MAADSGSDVLQQLCGSHRITRGTVGEIGHGDDVCEVSMDCAVEIITTDHCYDRNGSRAQCDHGGKLALQCLIVEPPFAGDDQIGIGDELIEVQ